MFQLDRPVSRTVDSARANVLDTPELDWREIRSRNFNEVGAHHVGAEPIPAPLVTRQFAIFLEAADEPLTGGVERILAPGERCRHSQILYVVASRIRARSGVWLSVSIDSLLDSSV